MRVLYSKKAESELKTAVQKEATFAWASLVYLTIPKTGKVMTLPDKNL
jgi:hypothetical protein